MSEVLIRLSRFRLVFGYAIAAACIAVDRHGLSLPGVFIAGLGIILRAWAAGCVAKNEQLAVTGPYALTRNPLYLGSFLFGAGALVSVSAWWLLLIFAVGFSVFYGGTILKEEKHLVQLFGDEFLAYRARVPVFFPYKPGSVRSEFALSNLIRNREHYSALGFVAFLLVLEIVGEVRHSLLHHSGLWQIHF